jgi:Raf kinase inhibitor-like YbhB/YbcL family protein
MTRIALFLLLPLLTGVRLAMAAEETSANRGKMELKSPAFSQGQAIPSNYTCDGKDVSPPLTWTETPPGTKSFALIVDDPDAPMGTWVHWVVYNLPPALRQLPEAFPTDARLSDGTVQGKTDFGGTGYGGPCPPSGTHRYFFKLFALDAVLRLPPASTAQQLQESLQGHILGEAQLMGTYGKKGR